MLATLHGLTRSRPDLLAESMSTFSTFAAPSRMPKDEIGAYLEAKLGMVSHTMSFNTYCLVIHKPCGHFLGIFEPHFVHDLWMSYDSL